MSSMDAKAAARRWFHPTPAWLVCGAWVAIVLLFASERWRWFSFNARTGYAVLLAAAIVGIVLVLLLAWMLWGLVFRRRARLKLRTLLVFFILCGLVCGWMVVRLREAPFGYQELDWSDLVPPPGKRSSNAAQKLSDTKARVYIHGFMVPGRRQVQMSEFAIIRTNDMDMFGPRLKANDVIRVKLAGDLSTDFTAHEIGIGGIFHVDPSAPGITPYFIDADCVRK
jgi:hypothetical protein